jgi:hypothetical protein
LALLTLEAVFGVATLRSEALVVLSIVQVCAIAMLTAVLVPHAVMKRIGS